MEDIPVYDEQGNVITEYDPDAGYLTDEIEEDRTETVDGVETTFFKTVRYVYHPYTEEELAKMKAAKEESDRREEFLANGPDRLDALEEGRLQTDEALTSLYEAMIQTTEINEGGPLL